MYSPFVGSPHVNIRKECDKDGKEYFVLEAKDEEGQTLLDEWSASWVPLKTSC